MLALVSYLGILVGDLVQEQDEIWQFYINLHQILQILPSRTISSNTVDLLTTLIESHHKDFCLLFNDTLKPKHHILLHYPSLILEVGPPRFFWAMKYEAFHKSLKCFAGAVTSRKNIIVTLTTKQQLCLSYRFLSLHGISDYVNYGPCEGISSKLLEYNAIEKLLKLNNIKLEKDNSVLLQWININHVKYKIGFCLQVSEGEIPNFGVIKFILSTNSVVYFVCSPLFTIGYNIHTLAYDIKYKTSMSNDYILISSRNMVNKICYNKHYTADGKNVIYVA